MKFAPLLLAVLSGILLWLGWPTYGFAGLLFIAFVPLLIVEQQIRLSTVKFKGLKVLGLSYLSFFIWNIATTYWLYYSTPFGMWFAVLVNSLLMALLFLFYYRFAKKATQSASLLFLVCLWLAFEYLHLYWDFSWPWLNLGNGFSASISWVQWYEYTGTFGGSLWIWIVNILIYHLVTVFVFKNASNPTLSLKNIVFKKSILPVLAIALPLIVSLIIGFIEDNRTIVNDGTQVVIVQPNIDPYLEKYNNDNLKVVDKIEKLAAPALGSLTDFIITPETVLAEPLHLKTIQYDNATNKIRQFLSTKENLHYLGGAVVVDVFNDPKKIKRQTNRTADPNIFYNDHNSAMFMKSTGDVQLYHKSKLVVGVENFPYKGLLEPLLGDAMIDLGGTVSTKTTQEDRSVFTSSKGTKVAPVICYESVYGAYVTDYVKNGAQFLAIITNDAWWNNTQGHKQHLSLARLRAIENRKYVARSANTGISAIIKPNGDIVESLAYGTEGIIKASIYPNDRRTFYSKHGDYIARTAIFMGILVLLVGLFRNKGLTRK